MPATIRIPAVIFPAVTEITPAAIGRYRFFGWSRSASASRESLRKYVPLAARQNATNAMSVSMSAVRWVSTPAAPGAAATSRFLTHCRGRASRMKPRTFELEAFEVEACEAPAFEPEVREVEASEAGGAPAMPRARAGSGGSMLVGAFSAMPSPTALRHRYTNGLQRLPAARARTSRPGCSRNQNLFQFCR